MMCFHRQGANEAKALADAPKTKRGKPSIRKDATQSSVPCNAGFVVSCPSSIGHLKSEAWKLIVLKLEHVPECGLVKPLLISTSENYLKGMHLIVCNSYCV
jgi:hypothetical protein